MFTAFAALAYVPTHGTLGSQNPRNLKKVTSAATDLAPAAVASNAKWQLPDWHIGGKRDLL